MRKLLLGLLVAVLPSTASLMAQSSAASNEASKNANKVTHEQTFSKDFNGEATKVQRKAIGQRSSANYDIIWSEDFSSGIPSTWVNTGTVNGTDTAMWEYRGPGTTPSNTEGSRGSCGGADPLTSPTSSNGFVIFDSNWWDDPGSDCGQGIGSGLVPIPHFSYMTTDVIDCSQYNEVMIEWYQRARHFSAIPAILVSSDGGATFDTVYDVRDFYDINGAPSDDYVGVDVSDLIGGSNNVVIKMSWSPSGRIPGADGYYYWMIDDLRLVERPDNDVAILPNTQFITGINFDDRVGEYAYLTPKQIDNVTFDAVVENKGKVDQPNVKVNFDVAGPNTYNQDSPVLPVLEVDSLALLTNDNNPFQPTDVGAFGVTMTVSSDSNDVDPDPFRPNNNVFVSDFTLSDSVMGLARKGVSTDRISTDIEWGGGIGVISDGIILGNILEMTEPDTITSVTIGLSVITRPGAAVNITVRDTTGDDFDNILLESELYFITQQDSVNGSATIPIPELLSGSIPQDRALSPNWFLVAVELLSSGNAFDIGILDDGTVPQRADMSLMFLPGNDWFTNGNAHHIWANFGDILVGVEDNQSNLDFSLTPNPASDMIEIKAQTDQPVDFQVVITNISGQTIKSKTFANTSTIASRMDISELATGVYVVKVEAGDQSIIRKLVVQ